MLYSSYKYLWPPRPSNAILPGLLSFYEKRKWIAQVKKNGSCCVIFVNKDSNEVVYMNRHNEPHKRWKPSSELNNLFLSFVKSGWSVFCGELIHEKTPTIKDTIYLFDILVLNSLNLEDQSYLDRYNLMMNTFNPSSCNDSHWIITNKLWLCKNIELGFENYYNKLSSIEDEGLVLRDPKATLKPCFKPDSNTDWLVKCRRGHKNYGF